MNGLEQVLSAAWIVISQNAILFFLLAVAVAVILYWYPYKLKANKND